MAAAQSLSRKEGRKIPYANGFDGSVIDDNENEKSLREREVNGSEAKNVSLKSNGPRRSRISSGNGPRGKTSKSDDMQDDETGSSWTAFRGFWSALDALSTSNYLPWIAHSFFLWPNPTSKINEVTDACHEKSVSRSRSQSIKRVPSHPSQKSFGGKWRYTLDDVISKPRLLKITEIPSYLRFNSNILSGYRPCLSFQDCFKSLFYLHNETVNIYTHFIPLLIWVAWMYHVIIPRWTEDGLIGAYPITCYAHFLASLSSWFGSSIYHTFMCHKVGEKAYQRLLKCDMVGIWLTQTLGAISTIYTSVHTMPDWFQWCFYAVYLVASYIGLKIGVFTSCRFKRRLSFIYMFSMRVVGMAFRVWDILCCGGGGYLFNIPNLVMQELWPIFGAWISALHVPECYAPGKFDYVLNSHNILHVLVIFGGMHMHYACYWNLHWLLYVYKDGAASAFPPLSMSNITATPNELISDGALSSMPHASSL